MPTNATETVACDVKDLALADMGKRRIEWAFQSMPVLQSIRKQFIKTQPLRNIRVAACLHVTTETANLMIALRDGGANIVLCASNPLSTQDDVASSLVRDYNIPVYAIKGENNDVYYSHIMSALDHKPQITMDDGADLVTILHTKRQDLLANVIGGTEETTTGVIRLHAMAKDKVLRYPIIANPAELGADRLVNAVAGIEMFGAPLIVVDFGTATTFDVINAKKEYLGGLICPGLKISADALFERASRLPRVEIAEPERLVGHNTVEAMQSGIFYGYIGMVDGILDRLLGECPQAQVAATGGLCRVIAPHTKHIKHIALDLPLDGLRILWFRNHGLGRK